MIANQSHANNADNNNNSNNSTMSRSQKPSLTTTVGWISILLSLSSQAHGFHGSSVGQRRPLAMMHSPGSFAESAPRSRDRRRHNNNDDSPAFSSSVSQLNYRNHAEDMEGTTTTITAPPTATGTSTTWWNNLFAGPQDSEETQQEVVDDYLEFLSRRYDRLYSTDKEEDNKGFSALNWLRAGTTGGVVTEKQSSDSLYVLGVAGLASQKLLQKHPSIPQEHKGRKTSTAPSTDEAQSISTGRHPVLDAICVSSQESVVGTKIAQQIVPVIKCLRRLEQQRQRFVQTQSRKVSALLWASLRTLIQSPVHASKAVLELGGGKKSITLTVAVAYAALLLLRPVLQAVISEVATP